jgi:murein DD-endopeptidase MepM/ murein hydrolase activator NlpD
MKRKLNSRHYCDPLRFACNDIRIILLLLVLVLSACAPGTQTPTPVIVVDNGQQVQVPTAAPTSTPPPLHFDLPTPGAEPISGWRPPLYPVPWAVSPYDHFYFTRPIGADNVNWPLAQYRYGGIFFDNVVHTGVDIPDDKGTPILAAGPGTVVWAGWGLFTEAPLNTDDPYGQAVAIRHDFGYRGQQLFTVYAHMEAVNVSYGQWVDTGDVIGFVGDTGQTTGPHLHFEVRLGENTFHNTLNPELWMSPPQGWGVLVGRILDEDNEPLRQYVVEVRPEPDGKPLRTVWTYGGGAINPDPFYNENMALSDLPAGIYKIALKYDDKKWQFWVEIFPGQVTYFNFQPERGFALNPVPTPRLKFIPPTPTFQATP